MPNKLGFIPRPAPALSIVGCYTQGKLETGEWLH